MNSETLKEINRLVAKLKEVESFCSYFQGEDRKFRIRIFRKTVKVDYALGFPYGPGFKYFEMDADAVKPAVIAYRDKIKNQLKELGYES